MATSEYVYTDRDGDKVHVYGYSSDNLIVGVTSEGAYGNGYVTKEEAPALALAVLEAAGYTVDHSEVIEEVIIGLRAHLTAQGAAKEKEALLAEAKALYEYSDPSWAQHRPWDPKAGGANVWVRAAQKAREIHAAKEEAECGSECGSECLRNGKLGEAK